MGLYKDLEEAAQKVKLLDNFHPRSQNHKVYMRHYDIFETLGARLQDQFERIAELQQNN
jgi:gluconokinase